jgi:hypothetical protein
MIKFKYGSKSKVATEPFEEGSVILVKDASSEMCFDIAGQRRTFTGIIYVEEEDERLAIVAPEDKLYMVLETLKLYCYVGSWQCLNDTKETVTMDWSTVTAETVNAVSRHGYRIDTSINDVQIVLNESPTVGDIIGLKLVDDTFEFSVTGNGNPIENQGEDIIIDTFDDYIFTYVGGTVGWIVGLNVVYLKPSTIDYEQIANRPDLSQLETKEVVATKQNRVSTRYELGDVSGAVSVDFSDGDYQVADVTQTITGFVVFNLPVGEGMVLRVNNESGFEISFKGVVIVEELDLSSYTLGFFNDNGTIMLIGKSRII